MRLNKHILDLTRASDGARAACIDELFAFATDVFDQEERAEYEAMMGASEARETSLLLLRDGAGRLQGFNLVRVFELVIDGRPCDVYRSIAAMAPEHRGNGAVLTFGLGLAARGKIRRPWRHAYLLGSFIHPSAYYMFAKHAVDIWPRHDRATPARIQAFIRSMAETAGLALNGNSDPLLAYERVNTRQPADEAAFWTAHPRPEVQLFLQLNPDYGDGYGLVTVIPVSWRNLVFGSFSFGRQQMRRRFRARPRAPSQAPR